MPPLPSARAFSMLPPLAAYEGYFVSVSGDRGEYEGYVSENCNISLFMYPEIIPRFTNLAAFSKEVNDFAIRLLTFDECATLLAGMSRGDFEVFWVDEASKVYVTSLVNRALRSHSASPVEDDEELEPPGESPPIPLARSRAVSRFVVK